MANAPTQATPPDGKVHPDSGNKNPGRFVTGDDPQPKNMETPIVLDDAEKVKVNPETTPKVEEKAKPKVAPTKPRESFTMTAGHHYVVVGVFSVMSHSMKFTKEMRDKGYIVNVALNPKNNFYYVYIQSTFDLEEAKKIRNEYRWKNLFKEAWIYTME